MCNKRKQFDSSTGGVKIMSQNCFITSKPPMIKKMHFIKLEPLMLNFLIQYISQRQATIRRAFHFKCESITWNILIRNEELLNKISQRITKRPIRSGYSPKYFFMIDCAFESFFPLHTTQTADFFVQFNFPSESKTILLSRSPSS